MKRILIILMAVLLVFAFVSCSGNVDPTFYTVSFNLCGHGEAIDAIKVNKGNAIAPEDIPENPVEDGFIFRGWYANANFAGAKFNFSDAITSNITLYAKWEAADFTSYDYEEFKVIRDLTKELLYHVYGSYYSDAVTDESDPIKIEDIFNEADEWENTPKDGFYNYYGDLERVLFLKDKIGPNWLGDIDEVTGLEINARGTLSFPINSCWNNGDYYGNYQATDEKRIIVDSVYSGTVNYVDLNGANQSKTDFELTISYIFEGSYECDDTAGIDTTTWSILNLEINGYDFGDIRYHWENSIESIDYNGKHYEGTNDCWYI